VGSHGYGAIKRSWFYLSFSFFFFGITQWYYETRYRVLSIFHEYRLQIFNKVSYTLYSQMLQMPFFPVKCILFCFQSSALI
jgi:hypothetical protein